MTCWPVLAFKNTYPQAQKTLLLQTNYVCKKWKIQTLLVSAKSKYSLMPSIPRKLPFILKTKITFMLVELVNYLYTKLFLNTPLLIWNNKIIRKSNYTWFYAIMTIIWKSAKLNLSSKWARNILLSWRQLEH